MIEKIIYKDDSVQSRYVDGYDQYGNRIARTIYNGQGTVTSSSLWKYKLDSHGNRLQVDFDSLLHSDKIDAGESFPLEVRTITYY